MSIITPEQRKIREIIASDLWGRNYSELSLGNERIAVNKLMNHFLSYVDEETTKAKEQLLDELEKLAIPYTDTLTLTIRVSEFIEVKRKQIRGEK